MPENGKATAGVNLGQNDPFAQTNNRDLFWKFYIYHYCL